MNRKTLYPRKRGHAPPLRRKRASMALPDGPSPRRSLDFVSGALDQTDRLRDE